MFFGMIYDTFDSRTFFLWVFFISWDLNRFLCFSLFFLGDSKGTNTL